MSNLFIYGSLLYSDVQLSVINRIIPGTAAILHDYKRYQVVKQNYPGIVFHLNSIVQGYVIQVNDEELLLLDDYEGTSYSRISVMVMCNMEMISVFTYVFLFPLQLQGDWHLESDRLCFNKIIVSGNKASLPPTVKLLTTCNNTNKILFTFPHTSMSTKYASVEYTSEPINNSLKYSSVAVDPWTWFSSSKIDKQFLIYFTKKLVISLNTSDMLLLGCRNNDYIQVNLAYGTRYCQVLLDSKLTSNGIKLPIIYSDFVRCSSSIQIIKISYTPIDTIDLLVLSSLNPSEMQKLRSELINHIIAFENPIVAVDVDGQVYYTKWTAISPNTNYLYYKVTKNTKITMIMNKSYEPCINPITPFTRTLHESNYNHLTVAVIRNSESCRLAYIERHIKYTPTTILKCNLSISTVEALKSKIKLCAKYNKCLVLTHFIDLNDDLLHLLQTELNNISVVLSLNNVQPLDRLNASVHYTSEVDDYSLEMIERIQSKCWFIIPKSISFLSINELNLLEYKCKQRMLSYILHGKRSEIDADLIHFDKDLFTESLMEILKSKTKIPEVYWQDIGGLEEIKTKIVNCIELPLVYPQYFTNKKQSGILLYGPPGCGKTLVAKAIATECQLNFKSIKGPELLNQYIGESELNIRILFEEARILAPCVLFFDEIDALAPKRGIHGDSSGVMDRLVSQLMGELDLIAEVHGVVVIGATNRPDLLDNALLRPGRFDTLIYLGPCEERNQVGLIMNAHLKKYKHMVNIDKIVGKIPLPVTGADLFGFTSKAIEHAIDRLIRNNIDDVLQLAEKDFEYAIQEFRPSLTAEELDKYKMLKDMER
eukprot:NODE_871_length_3543_cov_0.112079.p1 type:complete len:824 gc:universal NODE_871_length_3543_cov_0.112079:3229-758(-)